MMAFEREEIREALNYQRESLQLCLNVIDHIMNDIGNRGIIRISRGYRSKFTGNRSSLIKFTEKHYDESIVYAAEGIANGLIPSALNAQKNEFRRLAKSLIISFADLCSELEKRSLSSMEKFLKDCFVPGSALISVMENFELAYVAFEQELMYNLSGEWGPVPMSDNIFEGRQLFGIMLSEGLHYSLKRNLLSLEQVVDCEPHIFVGVPRISILLGCFLNWFPPDVLEEDDWDVGKVSFYHNPYFLPIYSELASLQLSIIELTDAERSFLENRLISDLVEKSEEMEVKTANDHCIEPNRGAMINAIFRNICEVAHHLHSDRLSKTYREQFALIVKQTVSVSENRSSCYSYQKADGFIGRLKRHFLHRKRII